MIGNCLRAVRSREIQNILAIEQNHATASVSDGQVATTPKRKLTRPAPTLSLPHFRLPRRGLPLNPHARSITDSASSINSSMDASTPIKRSSTDAGLDSPRESHRSTESRPVAPRISKARACKSTTAPQRPTHHLRQRLTGASQAQNASDTRFAANSDQVKAVAPNVFGVASNAW